MVANKEPIFVLTPVITFPSGYLTAANTTADGTSGTTQTVFTGGTDGSFVRSIRAKASPAGNNVQTVLRIWINNGSSTGTAANNHLLSEYTLPATTASASAATPDIDIPLNLPLPASHVIFVTIGTAVANGWHLTGLGGNY